jgi:hypothetical protein
MTALFWLGALVVGWALTEWAIPEWPSGNRAAVLVIAVAVYIYFRRPQLEAGDVDRQVRGRTGK